MSANNTFSPTPEQELAQSYDRDIVVTANAGSGKTSVLVERYLSILMNYNIYEDKNYKPDKLNSIVLDPRLIVAITFTNQAASEMKQKIAKKIAEKLENQELSRNEIEKLNKIRELVSSARISTIHSFCSSVLREFPIEAGIIPNFSSLSDYNAIIFKEEAVANVIDDYFSDENSLKYHDIKILLNTIDRKTFQNNIKYLINFPDLIIAVQSYYAQDTTAIKHKLLTDSLNLFNNFISSLKRIIITVIKGIDTSSAKPKDSKKLIGILDLLPEIESLQGIEDFTADNIKQTKDKVTTYISTICTKSLLFSAVVRNNSTLNLDVYSRKFQKSIKLFLELCDMADTIDLIDESINLSKIFFNIATDVLNEYKLLKNLEGALDFNDLILKTYQVLENPDIATKIAKKIKFLMVDEFQDTDDIQYGIIKRIVPELENYDLESKTNLFIVGDGKQSIYGFRNADVRVFEQAKQDIKALNNYRISQNKLSGTIHTPYGIRKDCSSAEISGNIELTASFRLLPNLAAFVNTIFENLLSTRESDFDINYSSLVVAKNTDNIISGALHDQDKGSIEFLITIKPQSKKDDQNDENYIIEPEIVAKYILNCIKLSKENQRDYNFSDFAVLSRSATDFGLLTFEFMKYGIPFKVHSGKGFYQTLEISDIISFLSFLNDTNDDFSLIAILRSAFFNLSNTDLLNITCYNSNTNERTINFFNKLKIYAEQCNDETSQKAKRTVGIISDLLSIVSNMPISQLIHQILEKTFWYASIKIESSCEQIEANMQKFIQSAREFENQGFKNLQDFIEEFKLMIDQQNSEPEATILNEDNVVNIMTVHASKGLEFPVVILFKSNPFRDKSFTNKSFAVSKDYGVTFKYNTKSEADDRLKAVSSLPNFFNSYQAYLKESAEEKRILYVALTRAKERLVISAEVGKTADGYSQPNGFFAMILNGLSLSTNMLLDSGVDTFVNNVNLPVLHNNVLSKIIYSLKYSVITSLDSIENTNYSYESPILGSLYLENMDGIIANEIYSASRVIKFMTNKKQYIDQYILGFNDNEISNITDDDGDEEKPFDSDEILSAHGKKVGTMIHSMFEKISVWYDFQNNTYNKDKVYLLIQDVCSNISNPQHSKVVQERIFDEVKSVAETSLIKHTSKLFNTAKYEYRLSIPIGADFLTAIIDLLLIDEKGNFEIWDWKSNTIHKENIPDLKAHYEFQMKLYAYFILKLNPKQNYIKCRLLFTYLSKFAKSDEDWTVQYFWDRKSLSNMENELLNLIKEITEFTY